MIKGDSRNSDYNLAMEVCLQRDIQPHSDLNREKSGSLPAISLFCSFTLCIVSPKTAAQSDKLVLDLFLKP